MSRIVHLPNSRVLEEDRAHVRAALAQIRDEEVVHSWYPHPDERTSGWSQPITRFYSYYAVGALGFVLIAGIALCLVVNS